MDSLTDAPASLDNLSERPTTVQQQSKNTQTNIDEISPPELRCKLKEELKCLQLLRAAQNRDKDDDACSEPKCRPQAETGADFLLRQPVETPKLNCTKNTQTTTTTSDKDPFYSPHCKQIMLLTSCTKRTQTSVEDLKISASKCKQKEEDCFKDKQKKDPCPQPKCRPQKYKSGTSQDSERGSMKDDLCTTIMSSDTKRRVEVPDALREVLLEFSIAYLVEQPGDVVDYAVEFFTKLQENRRVSENLLNKTDMLNSPDESVMSQEEEPVVQQHFTRRKSVFAEAYDPENDADDDEGATAVFPKSDEQRARLIESVKNVLLFRSLEKEQMNQVLDAMFEKRVQPGEYIIRQGDDGDNFYVIESGVYKVIVNDNHIHTYNNSGIFGELALLYNMPRAATIQAESEGQLWAMDRQTFRRILLKSAFKKRKMYETLLDSVPMLKALQNYERMNLADALVTKRFQHNERIIKQGDAADGMYFIEEGKVSVRMDQEGGEIEISKLGKGQYFGELALVTHRPRAASVYADGEVKVAFLETDAFVRILGFLTDVMKRNVALYEEHLVNLARQTSHT